MTWTGRFTITDSTGTTVAAPNSTVSDGQTVEWGTGALTNASQFTAEPTYVTDTTVAIKTASTTSSSASASATDSVKGSTTASGQAAAATTGKTTGNANSNSTSGAVVGREVKVAMAVVAVLGSVAAFL